MVNSQQSDDIENRPPGRPPQPSSLRPWKATALEEALQGRCRRRDPVHSGPVTTPNNKNIYVDPSHHWPDSAAATGVVDGDESCRRHENFSFRSSSLVDQYSGGQKSAATAGDELLAVQTAAEHSGGSSHGFKRPSVSPYNSATSSESTSDGYRHDNWSRGAISLTTAQFPQSPPPRRPQSGHISRVAKLVALAESNTEQQGGTRSRSLFAKIPSAISPRSRRIFKMLKAAEEEDDEDIGASSLAPDKQQNPPEQPEKLARVESGTEDAVEPNNESKNPQPVQLKSISKWPLYVEQDVLDGHADSTMKDALNTFSAMDQTYVLYLFIMSLVAHDPISFSHTQLQKRSRRRPRG